MDIVYVVMVVESGDSCEGHPSCLGAFKNKDDAIAFVRNDMEDRCDALALAVTEVDFDEMYVVAGEHVTKWSIDSVEVQ